MAKHPTRKLLTTIPMVLSDQLRILGVELQRNQADLVTEALSDLCRKYRIGTEARRVQDAPLPEAIDTATITKPNGESKVVSIDPALKRAQEAFLSGDYDPDSFAIDPNEL
jgi:hypothetical protein